MLKNIMEGIALLETVPAVGQDENWRAEGRCARHPDPDIWFSPFEDQSPRYTRLEKDKRARARKKDRDRAKEMCQACPVKALCLRQAVDTQDGDYGLWGGLDKSERTKLKNMLAAKEVAA